MTAMNTDKGMSGRTRVQWATEWIFWWLLVAVSVFLSYQVSRPLWDAERLIADKKASCEESGLVLAEEKLKFGTNYYCKEPTL